MFKVTSSGDFKNLEHFLKNHVTPADRLDMLNKYGKAGVEALRKNTPVRTGKTANSWSYEIKMEKDKTTIYWNNSNVEKGWANIAILLQYGHGTKSGAYVQGVDYINPAISHVMDELAEELWKEVNAK